MKVFQAVCISTLILAAPQADARCERPAIPGLTLEAPGKNAPVPGFGTGDSYHSGSGLYEVAATSGPKGTVANLSVGLSAGSGNTAMIYTGMHFAARPAVRGQYWAYLPGNARITMGGTAKPMVMKARLSEDDIRIDPGFVDAQDWIEGMKRAKTMSVAIEYAEGQKTLTYTFDVSNLRRMEAAAVSYWRCVAGELGLLDY